jgi:hypothetical protein
MYAGILENPYRFLHCWLILRHENKWNTLLASLSTSNNAENGGKTVEGSKEDTLPTRIERPMGRNKTKKLRSNSTPNSTAWLEVLQKMQCDRQVYEQRLKEATIVAETGIVVQPERKLGIQEEQLHIQQVLQVDRQRLEAAKNSAGIAIAAQDDRKLAIQEEQLCVQHRLLTIQEEQQENLVMIMDLDKVTPWVRDFYTSKQKELAAKRAQHDDCTSGSGI